VWNPQEAKTYELAMSSVDEEKEYVLEWMSLRCEGAGCRTDDDTAILNVDGISSMTIFADMSVAGKSGIFPIKFVAVDSNDTEKEYEGRGTLQIFAEGLPEFAEWQLAVAMILLTIFIWRRPEILEGRRMKHGKKT
ncbi:MAG: hypothetical protein QMD85_00560, partial [Candidatus Aenigmarchaeota archaeon]|nr:hypothetical protein [Candidatus Aenigmarchaeota archaeon]